MTVKLAGPMVAPTEGTPKRLMVLLHGYGANGDDLISLGSYWQDLLPETIFMAPNAPEVCDINPAGFQWFPLEQGVDMSRLTGAETARPVIEAFLEEVWAATGIGPEETFLVGFSQGGMMALEVGLRLKKTLKGILSFSGGLVAPEQMASMISARPPVLLAHGAEDNVVPVGMSVISAEMLKKAGLEAAVHISPGTGHTIAADTLEVAASFIAGHME